jgi:hypothetical protein
MEKGITAREIRGNLTVSAVAEANFATDVPKDAKYRIEGVEVFLKTGANARASAKESSGRIRMRSIQSSTPRKGDFLIIKVNKISRINYKGERERISVRGMIYTVPIN